MADLTPPVCLAAFTGAGIAGASPSKTGFTATKIALTSYLMPYMFVYNPMLLMQNVVPHELFILVVSALLGVIVLAGALEGWMFRFINKFERVVLGIAALIAIHHNMALSLGATVAIILMMLYLKKTSKKEDLEPAM